MPFIPHTEKDTDEMLAAIGAPSLDALFDEIPAELIIDSLDGVPDALSEMQITRLMRERAAIDGAPLCFIGGGAYEHHIPTAVWDIATRGEYFVGEGGLRRLCPDNGQRAGCQRGTRGRS